MGILANSPRIAFVLFGALACASCDDGHLRGTAEPSQDGRTYLVVADGNNCDQIKIDGVAWPHAIGQVGPIASGNHVIDCNGEISFYVPAGVTFKFDYWGP